MPVIGKITGKIQFYGEMLVQGQVVDWFHCFRLFLMPDSESSWSMTIGHIGEIRDQMQCQVIFYNFFTWDSLFISFYLVLYCYQPTNQPTSTLIELHTSGPKLIDKYNMSQLTLDLVWSRKIISKSTLYSMFADLHPNLKKNAQSRAPTTKDSSIYHKGITCRST